jgi:2-keto-4-pentenoate hydratase/2-oxohepta-3-ene-1,7-dioic acid hydratase in catechol pathway
MKLCRLQPLSLGRVSPGSGAEFHPAAHYAAIEGDTTYELEGWLPRSRRRTGQSWPLVEVRLLPPIEPSKIVCVGRNYREHIAELNHPTPVEPLIFLKPPSSLVGPEEPILLPSVSKRVDHEGELAVVIGRTCAQLGESEAIAPYLLGGTCLNDVTARDLQNADVQFTRAKGFDTFCPLGPVIETELDFADVSVETFVNGQRRQSGRTSQMIFSLDVIIRWISRMMTLVPGDVIATGTPAGVGPLTAGDVVEVVVEGVGTLRNPVAARED